MQRGPSNEWFVSLVLVSLNHDTYRSLRVALEACPELHSATPRRHVHDHKWRTTRCGRLWSGKRPESINVVVRPFATSWLAYLYAQQYNNPTDVSL